MMESKEEFAKDILIRLREDVAIQETPAGFRIRLNNEIVKLEQVIEEEYDSIR